MKLYKNIKSEQGAALIMILIAFMVITILATSVLVMAQNNTKQVVLQGDGMDSYYIARSGAEATFQALIESSPSKLTQFQTGSTVVTTTVNFAEGTANISIEGYNDGSTRRVRITSVGEAIGTNVTKRAILEFDYSNQQKIKWSR